VSDERRRSDREPLTLKVEYPEASDLVHDYTQKISRGGTFILTPRQLQVGTQVRIQLSFPGLLEPLTLDGTVRWVREGDNPDERGVGVEFDLADPRLSERLEGLVERIHGHDPALVARTLRVLIVEDNPHVADLLEEGLGLTAGREYAGRVRFEFERVRDGRRALELLGAQPFDLVIADVYLPVLDGAQVIRALRADARLQQIPVIAVSAGGPAARDLAVSAGADFFVEKPMRLQQILRTVKKLIHL
jgi:uncharacterized protein (TIGR02266 family)